MYRIPGARADSAAATTKALPPAQPLSTQPPPAQSLPPQLSTSSAAPEAGTPQARTVADVLARSHVGAVIEELERDLLRQALTTSHGNRTRAARLLGLNRDQIRYRIEKFGLEREFAPPSAPEPDGDAS